jgi:sugar phosphate permease
VSLFLTAISLAPLPFIRGAGALNFTTLFSAEGGSWWLLLLVLAVLSIGTGLTRPPLFGLLSVLTPAHEQGATLGIAQSAGSLARILGPMFAGIAFQWNAAFPYVVCAAICFLTGLVTWQRLCAAAPENVARTETTAAR